MTRIALFIGQREYCRVKCKHIEVCLEHLSEPKEKHIIPTNKLRYKAYIL
jgi:hypothetical protein